MCSDCCHVAFDDFVQMCEQRGWLVTRVSVQNQLDLFARAEQGLLID